jgi:biopolymer transport protein ExbD
MKHSDIAHYRQFTQLRRRFISRGRRFPPTLEPAALVDVVLLVFLFFLTSSTFVARSGIRVNLPQTEAQASVPLRSMVVTVTAEGLVFYNDRRTRLEELPGLFAEVNRRDPGQPLMIEADGSLPLEIQMRIYQDAVNAGVKEIYTATRPPPANGTP